MEQGCKNCQFSERAEYEEPCASCTHSIITDTWSGYKPKKDLNQLLREKLGYAEPIKPDPVKQPSHYMLKPGLEVRDVLELLVDKLQQTLPYPGNTPLFESDYVQMMQYLMRFMDKNGKQDLEKAEYYLKKLIESYE